MTVNTKIYDMYCDKMKELREIDNLEEKIKEVTGQLQTLNDQKKFNDGEYENWLMGKQTLQKDLEDRNEARKNMNGVIELFLNAIPIEDKSFIVKMSRDKFDFSKTGNSFMVIHTDTYQQRPDYRPEMKKYSIKD